MKRLEQQPIYYGWINVAGAFLIMAIAWGAVYNCSSLFIKPVSEELGFSRSEISATMTIRAVCQMLVSLFAGRIYQRFDMAKTMRSGVLVLSVSFFTYSLARTLWMFYLITVVNSVAITFIAIIPLSIILNNWFVKNRGMAIGIAFMGSGIGGMVLSPLTGIWIASYGWRAAYQILASFMALALIPCVYFVMRIHPKDMGLLPYGAEDRAGAAYEADETSGILLFEALRRPSFWALNLSSVCFMLGVNALMTNVAPHLTDIGYSIPFSANIVALTMGSLAIGKLILGRLFDDLGVRRATIISCSATAVSLIGLIYSDEYWALVLVVLFTGVGSAYATIANPVLAVELYGKKDYNAILGFLAATGSLGGIIGPVLTGYLHDESGSYLSSFWIFVLLCLLSVVMYLLTLPKQKQKQEPLDAKG